MPLFPPGENHPNAKLTEEIVCYILSSPKTAPDMAREVGVSKSLIGAIRAGKIWKHIPRSPINKSIMVEIARNLNSSRKKCLLSENQVRDIKRNLAIGGKGTKAALARKHGVSFDTVRDIERGRTWTFVEINGSTS
jgi:hypothetical protein